MKEKPSKTHKAAAGKAARGTPKSTERSDEEAGRSFEEAFAQAERAVDLLERGDLALEESLRTYEEGIRGLQRCYEILGGFESRIEVLASELGRVAESDDGPLWVPAGSVPALRDAVLAARREAELPQEAGLPQGGEAGAGVEEGTRGEGVVEDAGDEDGDDDRAGAN